MQETSQIVNSASWWISVTLVGIIFTFIVPFLKNKMDQIRGKNQGHSDSWKSEVDAIKNDSARQSLQVARVAHHYGRAAFFGIIALLTFLAGDRFSIPLVSVLIFLAASAIALLGVQEFRYGKASYEQIKDAGES